MIEVGEIGFSLNLTGEAEKKMLAFMGATDKAAAAVKELNELLSLTDAQFKGLNDVLALVNPKMSRLMGSFSGLPTRFNAANTALEQYNRTLAVTGDHTAALVARNAALSGRGSGGSGGGSGHRSGFHASPLGMGGIGYGIGGGIGLGALAAGYVGYMGYKEQGSYQQALAQFAVQNSGTSVTDVDKFIRSQSIHGVSNIDLMSALTDSMVVTKNYDEAKALAPIIAQMRYSDIGIYGHKMNQNQYMDAIRVAEIKSGSKDIGKIMPELEHMQRVKSSSGGRVLPSDYRLLMRRAGVAGKQAQDDFLYYGLEPIIQEQGGSSTGQQLMSVYSALSGGHMTTQSAIRFGELGLIKPGGAEFNKMGMIKRLKPGGVVGNELASTDLLDWVYKVYLPALVKKGITSRTGVLNEIGVDFSNRNASNLISTIYLQQSKILANIAANQKGAGIQQSVDIASKLNAGKTQDLTASFSKFKQALGDLTGGMGNALIGDLAKFFNFATFVINGFVGISSALEKASNAFNPIRGIENYFSQQNKTPVQVNSTIVMPNGDVLAKHVTTSQAKVLARPQTSSTQFNPAAPFGFVQGAYNGAFGF